MLVWWSVAAFAEPPTNKAKAEEKVVIEVRPSVIEGSVKVSFPGREGDALFVDEWPAGELPVQTTLAEGSHRFRVEGRAGRVLVEAYVTPVTDQVVELDLTKPPKPPTAAAETPVVESPAPAPRP